MEAMRGALAAGLLPWPQTRARLGLLLAVSLAAHLGAVGALPRLMAGVSPGTAASPSQVLRVALRPASAPVPASAGPEAPASAPAPPPPTVTRSAAPVAIAPGAAIPRPASPAAAVPPAVPGPGAGSASSTGPAVAPVPIAGPPAKGPVRDPKPRQGSELAAAFNADGPLSGPRYLQMKEVDQRPAPITRISPVYPPEAGQAEGRVVVRLLISENGGIDRIEIVSADPPGLFERATLEAFGNARYQPALKSNVRVKSQMTFEVRFLREDGPPSPDRLPPPIPTGPPKAGG